jgi:hypothetical protein
VYRNRSLWLTDEVVSLIHVARHGFDVTESTFASLRHILIGTKQRNLTPSPLLHGGQKTLAAPGFRKDRN